MRPPDSPPSDAEPAAFDLDNLNDALRASFAPASPPTPAASTRAPTTYST